MLKSPTRGVGDWRFLGFRVGIFGSKHPPSTHAVRGGFRDRVGNFCYFLQINVYFTFNRVFFPLKFWLQTSWSNLVQRMDKKHRFHARGGFFVSKKTIKLPTRSLFEWDLKLQSHELTHVGSGTFRRNRVGGAHPTWGYPRVGKALVETHHVIQTNKTLWLI